MHALCIIGNAMLPAADKPDGATHWVWEVCVNSRTAVAACLAFGLLVAPGVALADPWAPHVPSDVPWVWDGHGKGDVCKQRGEPPCHTTTTTPPVTTTATTHATSTGATTTTTDVSGTSATSATTTGTATSTTAVTTTTGVGGTTATSHTVPPKATVPAGPPLGGSTATNALADTGATPLWTGLGGLAVLLAGAVLVLFSRRRRA
jgi:LPXTG-motif cell wall-anchored protein